MSDIAHLMEENRALRLQIDRMWSHMTKEQIKKMDAEDKATKDAEAKAAKGAAEGADAA
jgi:regulator of replication initiation timing